jgi:hypothetical protein
MKKFLALVAVLFTAFQFASAQDIKFAAEEINYGTIEKGANGVREFKFTNTGDAPLIIESAQGSCGCTVPQFPKEPIMPGESNVIRVQYDTQRLGQFTKYVTVTTNSKSNTTHRLKIYGDVKEQAPATPAKDKGFMN